MFREDIDDRLPSPTTALENSPVAPTAAQFGAGDVGWCALIPSIIFTALATAVVALRWYTRCRIVHHVGLDDYFILLPLVSCACVEFVGSI
jgi:hypothetical protein